MERLTEDLPGSGGVLLSDPEDFAVDEVLAYAPSGAGVHVIFDISKVRLSTLDDVKWIARLAGLGRRAIGFAGMTDRHAVARQLLSVPVPLAAPLPDWSGLEGPELRV